MCLIGWGLWRAKNVYATLIWFKSDFNNQDFPEALLKIMSYFCNLPPFCIYNSTNQITFKKLLLQYFKTSYVYQVSLNENILNKEFLMNFGNKFNPSKEEDNFNM